MSDCKSCILFEINPYNAEEGKCKYYKSLKKPFPNCSHHEDKYLAYYEE